ncbi:MAG: type II secretion system protein GspJ [Thermodesulfobacteriota bacterium]|nr:type II secretion system protein GspJ [Thermodesulfobacteriota bacterium]
MKNRPGLTLIDMLVALTILAVVMTAVYAVFASQKRAVKAATEGREVFAQGLIVLDRLSRDLRGAWLPDRANPASGIMLRFEGKSDRLDLATTAVLSQTETRGPDLVEVGYRVETDEDGRKAARRLVRRQDETPDDDPAEGGAEIILTRDLIALELVYLNGAGEGESTWVAAQAGQLPRAVRIKLVLSTSEGREETFTTQVILPLTGPLVRRISMPLGLRGLR